MSRNIDVYVPPMEQHIVWSGGFTEEECNMIKQTGELAEFVEAKIGSYEKSQIDEDIRKTKLVWIEPVEENHWIFERMNEFAAKINFDKFQMKLKQFDCFQYSKYSVGDHYDWHTDLIMTPHNGLYRKLSFSLMLSNKDEYEGGDFLLNLNGSNNKCDTVELKKGDLIVFYSYLPHKVTPVTKGERVALVTWALGDKIQ